MIPRQTGNQEIPKPETMMVNVKAIGEAVVYTVDGAQIPNDQFVSVPISAGIANAVKFGDLEQGEVPPDPPAA